MDTKTEVEGLAKDFESCRKVLIALGDENRHHLILEMMRMGDCSGARVGDITERTHLSHLAVSHHLQILKEAGILKVRKEATKNAEERIDIMVQNAGCEAGKLLTANLGVFQITGAYSSTEEYSYGGRLTPPYLSESY